MAMPRPSGKAQRIAEETIPGLNQNNRGKERKRPKKVPNDEVELKIVSINENRGRLPNEKKKTRL
jgi:hypothetical protein